MSSLISFFVQLALLRRAPQDLPASRELLVVLLLTNIVLSVASGRAVFADLGSAIAANVVDVVLTGLLLYALLKLRGHPARWMQTMSAFAGIGVLIGAFTLVYRSVGGALQLLPLVGVLDLVVFVWLHVALGHVLRHALQIPLAAGVVGIFAYTMLLFSVIGSLFALQTPS